MGGGSPAKGTGVSGGAETSGDKERVCQRKRSGLGMQGDREALGSNVLCKSGNKEGDWSGEEVARGEEDPGRGGVWCCTMDSTGRGPSSWGDEKLRSGASWRGIVGNRRALREKGRYSYQGEPKRNPYDLCLGGVATRLSVRACYAMRGKGVRRWIKHRSKLIHVGLECSEKLEMLEKQKVRRRGLRELRRNRSEG